MWRFLSQSVAGTAHQREGLSCQDFCQGVLTRPGEETFLVLVCADGAGSAERGDAGAALACQSFVDFAGAALSKAPAETPFSEEAMREVYRDVHARLRAEAGSRGLPARAFACTLLGAVLGERAAWFAQVGDGAIVVREGNGPGGDSYEAAFWPRAGEYVNTTWFITEPDFEDALQLSTKGRVEEVALFTDGLQRLALNESSRTVHRGFFQPMFQSLREAQVPEELVAPLRAFLDSPAVNERTDDDKTLMLALRAVPPAEPYDGAAV